MLQKFKDMGKILKQAQEMKSAMQEVQEELKKTVIPVEALNGKIKIEITGELVVSKCTIDPELLNAEKKATLEKGIQEGFSTAIKKAKDLATNKLQSISGGILPE